MRSGVGSLRLVDLAALSGVPAIFGCKDADEARPAEHAHLKLLNTETLSGGVVWLYYAVKND